MKVYQGNHQAPEGRFAIVVSRYNETITRGLLDGAIRTLLEHGVSDDQIEVAWVPGAFEIPTAASRMAASGRYVAIVCLGAVIRGETSHDQHINRAVSLSLAQLGVQYRLPVLFGVLTCNSLEQAIARSGGQVPTLGKDQPTSRVGNKGIECALAALEMVNLLRQLPPEQPSQSTPAYHNPLEISCQ
ncbi:MAG: 6,7-dimethyl-8-ribityllumazine synthase [Thermoguttaceae bacterium]|nr:6,7-dimethyl-8-ribityllumazine synthase [Thermoguttaceae bacterium]